MFIVPSPADRFTSSQYARAPDGDVRPEPTRRPSKVIAGSGQRDGVVLTYNVAIICYQSAGTHYSSGALILSVMACHSLERTQAGPLCLSER